MYSFRPATALILFGLALTSCEKEDSANIDQSSIWTGYTVEYNAEDHITRVHAQFKVSHQFGTMLRLTDPAEVLADGQSMSYNEILGRYERSFSGLNQVVEMDYTDLSLNTYENELEVPATTGLPQDLAPIDRSESFVLDWVGPALQSGETLKVTIRMEFGTGSESFSTSLTGAGEIVLDNDELMDLPAGTAILQFERERSTGYLDDPGTGGRITERFLSEEYVVILE